MVAAALGVHGVERLSIIGEAAVDGAAGSLETIHNGNERQLVRGEQHQPRQQLLRERGGRHILAVQPGYGWRYGGVISIAVHVGNNPERYGPYAEEP